MARRSRIVLVMLALPFLAAAAPFRGGALDPPRPAPDSALSRLACSVHEGGQVGIVVTAAPRPGWPRLHWRVLNLIGR
jgi:hypothetical protein